MICDLPCLEINLELGLGPLGYLGDANVKPFQKICLPSKAHRISQTNSAEMEFTK